MDLELMFQLFLHGRRIHRTLSPDHREHMMTGIILWLIKEKKRTVSELAMLVSITPSTISEKLTQLEKTGLLSRENSRKDKRTQLITLTHTGSEHLKQMIIEARQHCGPLHNSLTPEESTIFTVLLKKLLQGSC
jgi:DNA-binding MarR family transcriptional regulator